MLDILWMYTWIYYINPLVWRSQRKMMMTLCAAAAIIILHSYIPSAPSSMIYNPSIRCLIYVLGCSYCSSPFLEQFLPPVVYACLALLCNFNAFFYVHCTCSKVVRVSYSYFFLSCHSILKISNRSVKKKRREGSSHRHSTLRLIVWLPVLCFYMYAYTNSNNSILHYCLLELTLFKNPLI